MEEERDRGALHQALAILTCHLAGCGVSAPSMLRRECRRAGKIFFPGNIEGALPEGPASNGIRPTDRLILHGVVVSPPFCATGSAESEPCVFDGFLSSNQFGPCLPASQPVLSFRFRTVRFRVVFLRPRQPTSENSIYLTISLGTNS